MAGVLFIGSTGAGKTTLLQRLRGEDIHYHKTQQILTVDGDIDTPGEYIDSNRFLYALREKSFEVDSVLLLQSATATQSFIRPGIATYFSGSMAGVITKIDKADDHGRRRAREFLHQAGAMKIFEVSALNGEGVPELLEYLGR